MKLVAVLLGLVLVSWDALWWLAGVKPMSPRRLRSILRSGRDVALLVDVRTSLEYRWLHIEEAGSYPSFFADPEAFQLEDRERPIVIICMSGHRSPLAAYRLKRRGYRQVSYLAWGMLAWIFTGGRTVRGA